MDPDLCALEILHVLLLLQTPDTQLLFLFITTAVSLNANAISLCPHASSISALHAPILHS